jgi:hypothetical protein
MNSGRINSNQRNTQNPVSSDQNHTYQVGIDLYINFNSK